MKKTKKTVKKQGNLRFSTVFVLLSSILVLTIGIIGFVLASFNLSLSNVLGIEITQQQLEAKVIASKLAEADKYLLENPRPISKISMEGKLGNDPDRLKTVESLKDVWKVYTLGFAYNQTKDSKYSSKAYAFMNAWVPVYKTTGNSIDESHLVPMIKGYTWFRPSLDSASRSRIDNWLISIGQKELAIKYNDGRDLNNWNSHRVQLITLIGLTTDNAELASKGIVEFKKQIDQNLKTDGTSLDFVERDALHYHVYNLMPLVSLAREARNKGVDLFTYTSSSGASIKKSVDFLIPYVNGQKKHAEFVNSTAAWDKTASASKTNKNYDPQNSLELLETYFYFDQSILPIIQKLRNNTSPVPSFEVLLASRQAAQASIFTKTLDNK